MQRVRKTLLFLLAIFMITSMARGFFEYRKNQAFYSDYEKQYKDLKKENTELKTNFVRAQDMYEFEKIARNKLNLQQPNEFVVVIPDPTPTVLTPTPTPQPNHKQWVDLFF